MFILRYQPFLFAVFCFEIIIAQNPFLEVIPYAIPEFEQYDIRHHTDHNYPTQTPNNIYVRFDGKIFYDNIW